MLYKAIPIFCLLAAAVSQNGQNDGDLESIIGQIFGTPPPTAATTLPSIESKIPGPSTLVPGVVTPSPSDDRTEHLGSIISQVFGKPSSSANTKATEKTTGSTASGLDWFIDQIFRNTSNSSAQRTEKPPGFMIPNNDSNTEKIIKNSSLNIHTTQKTIENQPSSTLDLESLFDEIFGNATPGPLTTTTSGNMTPWYFEDYENVLDLAFDENGPDSDAVVTNKPQDLTCTTTDGEAGECVPYYLCNINNNTVNIDGVGVIDIRVRDGPCLSYIDTCCLVPDKAETPVTPKPEAKREGCGWRNPKGIIRTTGEINGETKFAEFPWMCAILKIEPVNDNEPDGQKLNVYVGGGSLIHPSVVLTAAHYVSAAPQLRVRGGEWDTQSIKEPYPYQDREVASIELHQDFNKGNLFYDIALLFLSTPMELAPNVGVACLPPPRERTRAASRCFATGWGKDKFGKEGRYQVILKKIEVPVVDRATCQTQLRKTRLGRFFELHTSFMCAGGEAGKDTCKGDGGSPLSCPIENEDGRYMQSGIVAWGIGCGEDGTPGVYVDVSNLRNWVDDKVAGKGYDPKVYSF